MDNANEVQLDCLLSEYYKWVIGEGGTDPGILLQEPLSASMRRELIESMNDVNVAVAFAEFVREAVLPREVTEVASARFLSRQWSSPPLM